MWGRLSLVVGSRWIRRLGMRENAWGVGWGWCFVVLLYLYGSGVDVSCWECFCKIAMRHSWPFSPLL